MLHFLTVIQGATTRRALQVTVQPLVLGRDASRPFHLPDADVSRSHCEVRLADGCVRVRDLGSTNGTFIDGEPLTDERVLPPSAELRIGRHTLRHELLSPSEASQREQLARELERARQYLQSLIPAPIERGPVLTDWVYAPSSELAGDALGTLELDAGRLAFYVLDVCGHGVASAMHSASVLNTLRSRSLPGADLAEPGQVLERLNFAFPMDEHGGLFFSIFYAVLDPASGRMRYSSAGHPPSLLLGAGGRIRARLALKNPPIGTVEHRVFGQGEAVLDRGERLYVLTDGVFEFCDRQGRQRGLEEFEQVLESGADRSRGEPTRLYEAACALAGPGLLSDDFTLLVVERDGPRLG